MTGARLRALLAAAGVFAGLYWLSLPPRGVSRAFERPEPAPALSFPDLAGKTRSLSELRGKVVLVDFWATWCEPCLEAIPELSRLHEDLKREAFAVVGVALDARGREAVAPFVAKHRIPYLILLGDSAKLRSWKIPGVPTSFLINAEGRVLKRYLGAVPYAELARDAKAALGR